MARGGVMIGAAVAAAATFGKPIRAAAEFEHNLQMIGNTASLTKVQIGALKKEIFAVSEASNKGIADVTSGIGFLIAAGMSSKTAAATRQSETSTVLAVAADSYPSSHCEKPAPCLQAFLDRLTVPTASSA